MESLLPRGVQAASAAAPAEPVKAAFVYVPNGVIVPEWTPTGEGRDFQMAPSMKPIEPFRDDLQIIGGLEQEAGWAGKDGGGDHARAHGTWLTGVRIRKTAGSDIQSSVSIDQVMAQSLAGQTRLPSLELSTDASRKSGNCDSGYSCAYQFNLSWQNETTPVPAETDPRLVFERLFGSGAATHRARTTSILDFVLEDARSMQRKLGRNDRQKLDEYLTGVRSIEQKIEAAEKFGPPPEATMDAPAKGIPGDYQAYMRIMMDLMVAAFESGSTRIATFSLAHDGSNRNFKEVGVSEGHHNLSHHRKDPDKIAKLAKIDRYYLEQLAYLMGRMKEKKGLDGKSLLDSSMVLWGGGLADADRHQHDNLPTIVAGRANGQFHPGQFLNHAHDTPMANLHLNMLAAMGIEQERFADSTGMLKGV